MPEIDYRATVVRATEGVFPTKEEHDSINPIMYVVAALVRTNNILDQISELLYRNLR